MSKPSSVPRLENNHAVLKPRGHCGVLVSGFTHIVGFYTHWALLWIDNIYWNSCSGLMVAFRALP